MRDLLYGVIWVVSLLAVGFVLDRHRSEIVVLHQEIADLKLVQQEEVKGLVDQFNGFETSVHTQGQEIELISSYGKRIMYPGGRSGVEKRYFDPWDTFLTQMRHAEMLLERGDKGSARTLALSAFSLLRTFCGEAVLPPLVLTPKMKELIEGYYFFGDYPEDWISLTANVGGC